VIVSESTADHYLRDLGYLVRERANEVRAEVERGEGSRDELMAYVWVVSLMQEQAVAFGIPLRDLCLDGIDPYADLLL
jgi:hypothetical protein